MVDTKIKKLGRPKGKKEGKKDFIVSNIEHNGSSVCSMENYKLGDYLPITINPAEQFFGEDCRLSIIIDSMYKFLRDNTDYSRFELWPEISGKGQVHFHGIVRVGNPIKFHLMDVPRLIMYGHINIDICGKTDDDSETVKLNMEKWKKYCTKNTEFMTQVLLTNRYIDTISGSMTSHERVSVEELYL